MKTFHEKVNRHHLLYNFQYDAIFFLEGNANHWFCVSKNKQNKNKWIGVSKITDFTYMDFFSLNFDKTMYKMNYGL